MFLEEALRLRPELNLVLASPQDVQAATGCDLYIYDGVLPQTLPETGAVWAVNPTEAAAGITPGEAAQEDGTLRAATGEEAAAICEHLLLTDVAIRSFRPLSGGMPVLLSGGKPMLALSEGGRAARGSAGLRPARQQSAPQGRLSQSSAAWTLPLPWRRPAAACPFRS